MASLHPQNVFLHLTGRLSINLVLVVVLLDFEKFLFLGADVSLPDLGVPLEEMLCSYPLDRLQSSSEDVSL
jgi:hypothetical protein